MSQQKQKAREVKVVMLGDTGVGKSSILMRFVTNQFKPNYESTLGAAFMARMIYHNEKPYKFQIWDTAGQERYHSLAPLYYKDSEVAIIVYDITNRGSFDVLKDWIQELKDNGPKNITMALAGNKIDLIEKEKVQFTEASAYAKEINAVFNLTSAKEGKGVEDLFIKIAEELEKKEKLEEDAYANKLSKKKLKNSEKDRSCCY